MISIIYPFRNRDIQRIKFSLESLKLQTSNSFEVYFVNYGSDELHTKSLETLLYNYTFVNYSYLYTARQPWNKSKAINSVLRQLENGYFFVADIDLIFHPNFIRKALKLKQNKETWYFQVGLLNEDESKKHKNFEDYKISFKSDEGATGLTLCPVRVAKSIRGFDEFYHFWGSEDTDFLKRLSNIGHQVNFYSQELLFLHQWHKTYRNKESKKLSQQLQVTGIVQFNHYYLKNVILNNETIANNEFWGQTQSNEAFENLKGHTIKDNLQLSNKKAEIDYFLFQKLPNIKPGSYSFEIKEAKDFKSLKNTFKNILGKNTPKFYSLKTINDMILFHIINFYKNHSYNYYITEDLKSIRFDINIAQKI